MQNQRAFSFGIQIERKLGQGGYIVKKCIALFYVLGRIYSHKHIHGIFWCRKFMFYLSNLKQGFVEQLRIIKSPQHG